jgi:hypothetical protein
VDHRFPSLLRYRRVLRKAREVRALVLLRDAKLHRPTSRLPVPIAAAIALGERPAPLAEGRPVLTSPSISISGLGKQRRSCLYKASPPDGSVGNWNIRLRSRLIARINLLIDELSLTAFHTPCSHGGPRSIA